MIRLHDEADLEDALRSGTFLLFKHSTRCGASLRAFREVEAFEASGRGLPVYLVDVIAERSLARSLAARLGVRHESPQVILVEAGFPAWDASHGAIRADVLAERTASAGSRGHSHGD